jgi:PKD repeat protein
MMFRQDRWTFGMSVVLLALASVCVAQAALAQTTGSVVQWGNATEWDLPTPNENFTAIAAGWTHGLGLRENGSIGTWGRNYHGELDVPKPNRHFVAVAADYRHSLGLKSNGSIVAWGNNDFGQCDVPEPNSGSVAIATSYNHSLGLKEDGSIVAWGNNDFGQCDVPEPNSDFVAIAAGLNHSLGLKENGSIVAWGANSLGQCDVPSPNTGFFAIAAGYSFSLALTDGGSIVVWGYQTGVPEPNTGFVAIAAGYGHSLGLKEDGSVVGWGENHWGQCDAPSPNTGFFAIAAGGHQSLGLKGDSGEEPPTPPVAAFSGNPTSGPAPLTVYFTDLSTGSPTSWDWTFGDGGTSTAQHPSHDYTADNAYTVSLTAYNAQGQDTETKVDYITVSSGGGTCHVGAMDIASAGPPNYKASATVTVHDQDCQALDGVTVAIEWSGAVSGTDSGTTDGTGQVTFISGRNKSGGTYVCTVTGLTKTGYPYQSGDNHETCDSVVNP